MGKLVAELVDQHNTILMANHGVVSWSHNNVEDAYFKMEIIEAYCRTIVVAAQLGKPAKTFTPAAAAGTAQDQAEPRHSPIRAIGLKECELCDNDEWRPGVDLPAAEASRRTATGLDPEAEAAVKAITDKSWQNCQPERLDESRMKSLDTKLAAIKAGRSARATLSLPTPRTPTWRLACARPARAAIWRARGASGRAFSPEVWTREEFGYRNLPEFLDIIREVVQPGLGRHHAHVGLCQRTIDHQGRTCSKIPPSRPPRAPTTPRMSGPCATAVTPANRRSRSVPPPLTTSNAARSSATATDEIPGANLGLYSMTFVNDLEQDREALLCVSRNFARRPSAKSSGISSKSSTRTSTSGIPPEKLGEFINDKIIRTLAGVPEAGRPIFLKIVYHGPRAMEELAQYDPESGRRHSRRRRRHHLRCVQADSRRAKIRRARGALRPQDQQRGTSAGVHRNAAPDHRRPDFARGSRARLSRRVAGQRHQTAPFTGGRFANSPTRR